MKNRIWGCLVSVILPHMGTDDLTDNGKKSKGDEYVKQKEKNAYYAVIHIYTHRMQRSAKRKKDRI